MGNTWRYKFYMGMKNDMNLGKGPIFYSHLKVKDTLPTS